MKLFTTWVLTLMVTAYLFFSLGQDNPLPVQLTNTAEIKCEWGSGFSFVRNYETLVVKCTHD